MAHGTGTPRQRPNSIWLRPPRTRRSRAPERGRQTPLDLARITTAALTLLDAQGLDAFSMRRLASELGVTAMSVYWYVEGKEDLLELALDAVFGEVESAAPQHREQPTETPVAHAAVPDPTEHPQAPANESVGQEGAPGWHAHLSSLAHRLVESYAAHPWACTLLARHPNIGPHAVALRAQVRDTVRTAGLDEARTDAATRALLSFVHGYAARTTSPQPPPHSPAPPQLPAGEGEFTAALECFLAGIAALGSGAFPHPHPSPGSRARPAPATAGGTTEHVPEPARELPAEHTAAREAAPRSALAGRG